MVAIIITGALIFSNTQIASALVTGDLIKIKCTGDNESICRAVYYYGGDGKRYAFPNQKVFPESKGFFRIKRFSI